MSRTHICQPNYRSIKIKIKILHFYVHFMLDAFAICLIDHTYTSSQTFKFQTQTFYTLFYGFCFWCCIEMSVQWVYCIAFYCIYVKCKHPKWKQLCLQPNAYVYRLDSLYVPIMFDISTLYSLQYKKKMRVQFRPWFCIYNFFLIFKLHAMIFEQIGA